MLIAVRKGLSFEQINVSTIMIESTGIIVSSGDSQFHNIAGYFPGGRRCADWSQFRRDIRTLSTQDAPFFIIEDFNARHRYWN